MAARVGQAQYALGNDVVLHLGVASGDGAGLDAQVDAPGLALLLGEVLARPAGAVRAHGLDQC